jgi:hypothetical protein
VRKLSKVMKKLGPHAYGDLKKCNLSMPAILNNVI